MKYEVAEEQRGGQVWLITYSDLLTLLLTFFVISLSLVHEREEATYLNIERLLEFTEEVVVDIIAESFSVEDDAQGIIFNIPTVKLLDESEVTIKPTFKDDLLQSDRGIARDSTFRIQKDTKGIRITIPSARLFDVNKAIIRKEFMGNLRKLGRGIAHVANLSFIEDLEIIEELLSNSDKELLMKIRVEGHTDNQIVTRGKYRDNLELSTARAVTVARFFHTELGAPYEFLSAEGRGEFEPISDNSTVAGRALNRRVEIYIDSDIIDIN